MGRKEKSIVCKFHTHSHSLLQPDSHFEKKRKTNTHTLKFTCLFACPIASVSYRPLCRPWADTSNRNTNQEQTNKQINKQPNTRQARFLPIVFLLVSLLSLFFSYCYCSLLLLSLLLLLLVLLVLMFL